MTKTNFYTQDNITHVENAIAVYLNNHDGTKADEGFAEFSRPQDWASPHWMYRQIVTEISFEQKLYRHTLHCYCDWKLTETEFYQLMVPFTIQIMMGLEHSPAAPGYLDEDDFWDESWGPQPPTIGDDDYDDDLYPDEFDDFDEDGPNP